MYMPFSIGHNAAAIDIFVEVCDMHRVRRDDLPFQGHSHEFEGARHGGVRLSAFLFDGPPGSGPKPHRHPDDEVLFVREGRARYVVAGKEFEAEGGGTLRVTGGGGYSFTCAGERH